MDVNVFRIEILSLEVECWLYDNVGPGGWWLKDINTNTPIPNDNDEWGFYSGSSGYLNLEILDKEKAILYKLTWT